MYFPFGKIRRIATIAACLFYKTTKRQNVRSVKIKNQSFTLLEIVFTITIIGILLAICLPIMSAIKLSAQKVKDVSNLQTVAAAWRECVINRGWVIEGADNRYVTNFARQMAGQGKSNASDMVLNDPHVYISSGDKYASKVQGGEGVAVTTETISCLKNDVVDYTFCYTPTTNCIVTDEYLFSYCLMLNLPAYVSQDTTPLAFTRGLNKNGKWDEKIGLYSNKGGYVVYCDGHVTWFDNDNPAKFLHWNGQEYTTDIRQAVPNCVRITCTNDISKIKTDYRIENAPAVAEIF
ncbi:MAG: type II secretion system GspH family protein [Puniceicoccales bacterium]|nr:type II secretion system GspH family protein [Puniceicoccales bacterium]